MTVLYVDSSALLKRVIAEGESAALRAVLRKANADADLLTASTLAWVEVWRSLWRAGATDVDAKGQSALSGIAEFPLSDAEWVAARTIGRPHLRSPDAIHLAAAVAVGADVLVTYDDSLADAATSIGIATSSPS